jgi:hypothetical protein
MRKKLARLSILVVIICFSSSAFAQEILPRPEKPFRGHIGLTVTDGQAWQ